MSEMALLKIVKEHNEFHYLLPEIQLYTSILLELNTFLKKYYKKLLHQFFTIYLK